MVGWGATGRGQGETGPLKRSILSDFSPKLVSDSCSFGGPGCGHGDMLSHPAPKLSCTHMETDSPLSPQTCHVQGFMLVGIKSKTRVVELSSQQLFSGLGIQRMIIQMCIISSCSMQRKKKNKHPENFIYSQDDSGLLKVRPPEIPRLQVIGPALVVQFMRRTSF